MTHFLASEAPDLGHIPGSTFPSLTGFAITAASAPSASATVSPTATALTASSSVTFLNCGGLVANGGEVLLIVDLTDVFGLVGDLAPSVNLKPHVLLPDLASTIPDSNDLSLNHESGVI